MQVNGEEKINDATLPVLAHCLKDVDTGRPTKAELWPREQAESGLGLGVLGLLDTESLGSAKLRPTGASYQAATRDLLQLGTWVNQTKTANDLADKLEKYEGGFETYEDEEKAAAMSWFVPSTAEEDLESPREELNMPDDEGRDSDETKERGTREKAKGEKLPFDIDLDLGLRSFDSDDSNYSDDGVKSYYIANVAKAKKAKEERDALRVENSKLKMENERLLAQNGELMNAMRMADMMGCFDNLDKEKSKDAEQKLSK